MFDLNELQNMPPAQRRLFDSFDPSAPAFDVQVLERNSALALFFSSSLIVAHHQTSSQSTSVGPSSLFSAFAEDDHDDAGVRRCVDAHRVEGV